MHSWSPLQEGCPYCENDYTMLKLCHRKQTVCRVAGWGLAVLCLFFSLLTPFFQARPPMHWLGKNTEAEQVQSIDIAWLLLWTAPTLLFRFLIAISSSETQCTLGGALKTHQHLPCSPPPPTYHFWKYSIASKDRAVGQSQWLLHAENQLPRLLRYFFLVQQDFSR